ncbi:Bactoprenol glucosyl transferase homolog from prophage CPS-53 [Porphyromonas cangingivalis]|uniref:glycosyltransferase family 2 protein n=1 Tax=Porphyromonas cangingivalis TaxID=36874 RepID=UPI000D86AF82|nr:glycosyltransferase family 2 protein [Porphyromonas cangingivalis]SPY36113.1 Bactoprenol glucosyl transferase homolog from prophage CPS-53 [Porphyromonas cangingivalis]
MKESLTIIIPCYNEEDVLETTFQRLLGILPMIPELEVSFLFVNDGSKDGTAMILNRFAREQERVQVIHFSRNFGHQSAVTAGINHAVSDYVVVIDADLQDPPEAIPEMWHYLKDQNANVVYGVRQERRDETWFKKCTAKIFYRLLNYLSETPFPVDTGDFRIMDRKVVEEFNALPEHNKYIRGLISWMGYNQVPYYYHRHERAAGKTKYGLRKMLKLAFDAILYFSYRPLKVASGLGFASVIIGLLLGLWIVFGKFLGFTHPETGWTSIVTIVIFFGGVQLITIGLVSRYIGVIFDEVKRRPEYIVAQKINVKAPSESKKNKDDK